MSTRDDAQKLREDSEFMKLPEKMRSWILESPNATADFAPFFEKGGEFQPEPNINLPYYSPQNPPRIYIDGGVWYSIDRPGMESIQRETFGTLAHEIGHDRYNTGNIPFTGRNAEDYVQYRSELEGHAIFNAFPIFRDLEHLPEFKDKPFGSIGYLNQMPLAALYGEWRAGKIDDAAAIRQISAKVADAPYTLSNPPADMNHDGQITHRDAYLQDYKRYIEPKLEPHSSVDRPGDPTDQKHPGHDDYRKIHEAVARDGRWTEEQSTNISAALFKEYTADSVSKRLDSVRIGSALPNGDVNLFAVYEPWGPDKDTFHSLVGAAEAARIPAERSFEQAQQITQHQELTRQQEPTRGPDDPTPNGPTRSL